MARNNQHNLVALLPVITQLIRKYPLMLLIFLLFGGGWYGYEVLIARPAMSFKGVPSAQTALSLAGWSRIFRNEAFMLGYSDLRGNPLWVVYQIQAVPDNAPHLERPSRFTEDWRSLNKVKHDDYNRSGYDRGHLAPNYAISSLYGKAAQSETFLMTNISPQKPNLNRKLWQRLEEAEIKYFTQLAPSIWVVAGPVFDQNTERLSSASRVEIPDAFYKLYAFENGGQIKLLAFLMPQNVTGHEALTDYVVNVDKIEDLTGLDFFADLEDGLENQLEAEIDTKTWRLDTVAHIPSRY